MKDKSDFYKILVVEDNPDTLDLVKFILENDGHQVVTAKTAGETLTILDGSCQEGKVCFDYTCKGKCFDAVLLDFDLPDITGGTLGGYIRNKFRDMAILIFTGYGRLPSIVKSAKTIGATLITKPIEPDALIRAIDNSINVEKSNRERRKSPVTSNSITHILEIAKLSRGARFN